jgi:hypothetical protein
LLTYLMARDRVDDATAVVADVGVMWLSSVRTRQSISASVVCRCGAIHRERPRTEAKQLAAASAGTTLPRTALLGRGGTESDLARAAPDRRGDLGERLGHRVDTPGGELFERGDGHRASMPTGPNTDTLAVESKW